MTTNIANIKDHKEKRKLEVIASDLDTVLYLMKLIKSGLSDYGIYIPVKDVLICMANSEKQLKIHLEKIEKKLQEIHNKE